MGTNILQSRSYEKKIEQSQPTFPLRKLNLQETREKKNLKWSPSFIGAKAIVFSSLISWLWFIFEEHKLKGWKAHCLSFTSSKPTPFQGKGDCPSMIFHGSNRQDPSIHI